jgi:hypothetical protein
MSDYQSVERQLLGILADLGTELDPGAAQEIQMYLDAGEYGLALETICAVLKQKSRPVSAATYVIIMDLAKGWDLDPSLWQDQEVS